MPAPPRDLSLPGQFLVCRRAGLAPADWDERRLASLSVATAPGVTVTPLRYGGLDACALVVGTAIRGRKMLTTAPIELAQHDAGAVEAVQRFLSTLGGRHVAIVEVAGAQRLYLDAAGSRAAVYSPELGIAASTPLALDPEGYDARLDHDLASALRGVSIPAWCAGTLTAHRGILRLLPNHFLDLQTWTAQRFRGLEPPAPRSPEEALPEIASIVRDTFAAVADARGVTMPLTAGQDSRLLLACARELVAEIQFFTFVTPEFGADEQIARALARRLGLSWRALEVVPATAEESDAFLRRTGHVVHTPIREIHPTLAKLDPGRVVTPGLAVEVARAYHWGKGEPRRLDAVTLADHIKTVRHPRVLDSLGAWLEGVAGLPTRWILELTEWELTQGCWAGPQMYGTDPFGDTLLPFCNPRVFELAHGLPESYRAQDRIAADLCRLLWPELLELPFNGLIGWPRIRDGLLRRARRLGPLAVGRS